ncbi:hypothetical protein ACE01N_01040 [Saccharicrinis sp. FJH2]|uniref:hypothetical protein n=1 Tax=Saccharicrinis sp. FJH65 TaxID=3344659 RepID=UPI0035F4038E
MKKITSLALLLFIVIAANVSSQGFNYQTVLRNSAGKVEANTAVVLKFTIKQGSESGTSLYSESHDVSTNTFGVISVVVGEGTLISGDFSTIDWSNGPYYLNVDIDGEDMGTSQLNSVPFANYAKMAESALTADAATSATNANHATSADNATSATNADYATNAGHATNADNATSATNADHATSADNATSATTANAANNLNITGAATGDVLYYDGSKWVRLAKGTDGQVLTVESGIPAWKDAAGSGSTGPEIGEAYDGGTIVEIYPNGDVLLVYNTQLLYDDGGGNISATFDYAKATALVPSGWHIPTVKEFTVVESHSELLPDVVWVNTDDYLTFWTASDFNGGGKFTYYSGFYSPLPTDGAGRLLVVKKVPYY